MTTKERFRSKSPVVREVLKAYITRHSIEDEAKWPEGFDALPHAERLKIAQARVQKRMADGMTEEEVHRYAKAALDWWDAEAAKAVTDEETLAGSVLDKLRDSDVWSKIIPKFSHTAPTRTETGRLECGIPRIKQ
jgi:hypothetical protein